MVYSFRFFRILSLLLIILIISTGCIHTPASIETMPVKSNHTPIPPESTQIPETISTSSPIQEEPPMETTVPEETLSVHLDEPTDSDFVRVKDYIPDIIVELKYSTSENFTGALIYNFQDVYLRYGTVKKLMAVQEELHILGLGLKIWDGFRPISAQFKLWEIYPDDTYVADPNKGFSNHSRGNAVDLTLVDIHGSYVEMPTEFDDFSGRADRNYSEIPDIPRANSELLQQIMEKHGFRGYYGEWWHYNDTQSYNPEWVFDPGLISLWEINGDTECALHHPSSPHQILAQIPAGAAVTLLGYDGDRALISWEGQRGYVDCLRLSPFTSQHIS